MQEARPTVTSAVNEKESELSLFPIAIVVECIMRIGTFYFLMGAADVR